MGAGRFSPSTLARTGREAAPACLDDLVGMGQQRAEQLAGARGGLLVHMKVVARTKRSLWVGQMEPWRQAAACDVFARGEI